MRIFDLLFRNVTIFQQKKLLRIQCHDVKVGKMSIFLDYRCTFPILFRSSFGNLHTFFNLVISSLNSRNEWTFNPLEYNYEQSIQVDLVIVLTD